MLRAKSAVLGGSMIVGRSLTPRRNGHYECPDHIVNAARRDEGGDRQPGAGRLMITVCEDS
jgi:hypothetical protein